MPLGRQAMTQNTAAAKPKGGRPPGRGITPAKVRKEMEREELARTGGRRFEVKLSAAAAEDLAHIRRREGLSNDTEACIMALHYYARLRNRNAKARKALTTIPHADTFAPTD